MQLIPSLKTLFKWERSPTFYTVALSRRLRCYDGNSIPRFFIRHELVYMDIVSASCEAEAIFEALSHYFSDRLTFRWQERAAPLSNEALAEIDVFANSLAFSFFRRLGTPSQILFAESGLWQSNQGPELAYEKTA